MSKILLCVLLFAASVGLAQSTPTNGPSNIDQIHSGLFTQRTFRGNLVDRAKREGDIKITQELGMTFFPHGNEPVTLQTEVKKLTCNADAVIIATVKNAKSFLTKNSEWVFTDNTLNVEEVIKNNSASALSVGTTIIAARSGGAIQLADGHHIEVADQNHPALRVGHKYLLFINYVPTSGEYITKVPIGAFTVLNTYARPLIPNRLPEMPNNGYDLFSLEELVRSSAATCQNGGRQ